MHLTDYVKSEEISDAAGYYLTKQNMADFGNHCVRGGYILQDCMQKLEDVKMDNPYIAESYEQLDVTQDEAYYLMARGLIYFDPTDPSYHWVDDIPLKGGGTMPNSWDLIEQFKSEIGKWY